MWPVPAIVLLRSQPEMTASPLQTRPSKVWTTPDHDNSTDLILEMAPSLCRLRLMASFLDRSAHFYAERASHARLGQSI
jgi:hypothetical protein